MVFHDIAVFHGRKLRPLLWLVAACLILGGNGARDLWKKRSEFLTRPITMDAYVGPGPDGVWRPVAWNGKSASAVLVRVRIQPQVSRVEVSQTTSFQQLGLTRAAFPGLANTGLIPDVVSVLESGASPSSTNYLLDWAGLDDPGRAIRVLQQAQAQLQRGLIGTPQTGTLDMQLALWYAWSMACFVLAGAAVVTDLLIVRARRRARRNMLNQHCHACGYGLLQLPDGAHCPECNASNASARGALTRLPQRD